MDRRVPRHPRNLKSRLPRRNSDEPAPGSYSAGSAPADGVVILDARRDIHPFGEGVIPIDLQMAVIPEIIRPKTSRRRAAIELAKVVETARGEQGAAGFSRRARHRRALRTGKSHELLFALIGAVEKPPLLCRRRHMFAGHSNKLAAGRAVRIVNRILKMKVSLNWLRENRRTPADRQGARGSAHDGGRRGRGIETTGCSIPNVVVAQINESSSIRTRTG